MKRLVTILLRSLASGQAWAQGEKGLVGYWSLDEGQGQAVRDASGMNHHGRIKGGAKWVRGRQGAAWSSTAPTRWWNSPNPKD